MHAQAPCGGAKAKGAVASWTSTTRLTNSELRSTSSSQQLVHRSCTSATLLSTTPFLRPSPSPFSDRVKCSSSKLADQTMQSAQAEGLQDPAVVSAARTAYYNAMPPQASGVPESTQPQQQQQHAGNQPPPDPSSYPFPPESAPYPFRSYEKHWPCSPPRSRASSAASIASSARESLASTDPSDAFGSPLTALEKHPTKLHASGSAGGFLVEVSGGTDPGVWPVSWSELVALLSNRESGSLLRH